MALKMLFFFSSGKVLCVCVYLRCDQQIMTGLTHRSKKVKKGFFSYKHVVYIIKSVTWAQKDSGKLCAVCIFSDQGGRRLKKKRHCICTDTTEGLQPLVVHVSQHMHTYDQTSRGSTFPAWGSVTSILQYASWPNPCVLEGVCWVSLFACVSRTNIGWRVE